MAPRRPVKNQRDDNRQSDETKDALLRQRLDHIDSQLAEINALQKASGGVSHVVQFDIQTLQEKVKTLQQEKKDDRVTADNRELALRKYIDEKTVPKERFEQLWNLNYGAVKLILTAFVLGLIALVYRTSQ